MYAVLQVTLKDFQTTMKVAKGKESASLPKKKAAIPNTPFARSQDMEDIESGFHSSERQALLQVSCQPGFCMCFNAENLLLLYGQKTGSMIWEYCSFEYSKLHCLLQMDSCLRGCNISSDPWKTAYRSTGSALKYVLRNFTMPCRSNKQRTIWSSWMRCSTTKHSLMREIKE